MGVMRLLGRAVMPLAAVDSWEEGGAGAFVRGRGARPKGVNWRDMSVPVELPV